MKNLGAEMGVTDNGKQMRWVSNSSFQDGENLFQKLGRNNCCILPSLRMSRVKSWFRSYKKQGFTSKISRVGSDVGVWILLNKISHIHGHLFNGGVVERLNVP